MQQHLLAGLDDLSDQMPSVLPAEPRIDWPEGFPNAWRSRFLIGTSSWSFPGWQGIVWQGRPSSSLLAREGLHAYAQHPLLRCVGIDRSFYSAPSIESLRQDSQAVPEGFRFLIKAPSQICDAALRRDSGAPLSDNPDFLNPEIASQGFVPATLEGLGDKLGVIVFQLSPLPSSMLAPIRARPESFCERLRSFFLALPDLKQHPSKAFYALELRDPVLLTPRLIKTLNDVSVRYCLGLHAKMPSVERQALAFQSLTPGPLVVRWSLKAGLAYGQAKLRFDPFNALQAPDLETRHGLAALIARQLAEGGQVFVIINNKAEGCAPLSAFELAKAVASFA